ncbi:MAG: D-glycerate dehydrogenase [Chloroflexota bacterium]|nr:D-glycerate dehydrogenase [Chloroflexota bacterium]
MKPKVFVSRLIPDRGLDLVKEFCDTEVWDGELPPPRDVLLEKVRDMEGLLCLLTDEVGAELLDSAPDLKVVSNYAVGFDNIDVEECTKRGIPVGNTPGVLTETTADLAWALLMAGARRIVEGADYVRAGRWKTWRPMLLLGQDVHGATLGIIGLGRIGSAMARRASGFDMRVLYYDIRRREDLEAEWGVEYADLDALLRESDFVTIHTVLNSETYHFIGKREFQLMKETAVLVDAARGPIIDPEALYQALKGGQIAYAALDVTEPEPINIDNPLLELDNIVIVPHLGSASYATRGKMAEMAARNLIAGLKGERLPTCVNPEVYEE